MSKPVRSVDAEPQEEEITVYLLPGCELQTEDRFWVTLATPLKLRVRASDLVSIDG